MRSLKATLETAQVGAQSELTTLRASLADSEARATAASDALRTAKASHAEAIEARNVQKKTAKLRRAAAQETAIAAAAAEHDAFKQMVSEGMYHIKYYVPRSLLLFLKG